MILAIEKGRTRSHFVKNSLWNMLWNCYKTDYRINEGTMYTNALLMQMNFNIC